MTNNSMRLTFCITVLGRSNFGLVRSVFRRTDSDWNPAMENDLAISFHRGEKPLFVFLQLFDERFATFNIDNNRVEAIPIKSLFPSATLLDHLHVSNPHIARHEMSVRIDK